MAWVGSPAQSQMSLSFDDPFPAKISYIPEKKNVAETLTRDMASSDWLKRAVLSLSFNHPGERNA